MSCKSAQRSDAVALRTPSRRSGFALTLYNQDQIEEDVRARCAEPNSEFEELARAAGCIDADRNITQQGWGELNEAIEKIEDNVLNWMNRKFRRAEDHGHAGDDSLVGFVWWNPRSQPQRVVIQLGSNGGTIRLQEDLELEAYRDVNAFGAEVIDGWLEFTETGPGGVS